MLKFVHILVFLSYAFSFTLVLDVGVAPKSDPVLLVIEIARTRSSVRLPFLSKPDKNFIRKEYY